MIDVARLEERHVSSVLAAMAEESRPFAGGIVARGAPGAWYNRAQGVGLDGPVDGAEIDAFIEFHASRGIEPRIELTPFAHESIVRGLADRGFVVRRFQIVFSRALDTGPIADPPFPAPPDLRIEEIRVDDTRAIESFGDQWVLGFKAEDPDRAAEIRDAARRVITREGSMGIRAMLGGACVGAAGLELDGEHASLFGTAVAPDARRRGIQLAMIAWRLRLAQRAGATIATIESLPGIATESNAARMGFTVAYCKVTMVRPGEGLTPVAP